MVKRRRSEERARDGAAAVERAFAKALGWEAASAASVSYKEVVVRHRRLERHYLKQAAGNRRLCREIRRRVAEQLLEQAIFHGCGLKLCRERLRRVSRLGFTNVERKAHYYLLYAKGAFARGHKRVAHRTTTAIARELERTLGKRKNPLARDLLRLANGYLRCIEEQDPRWPRSVRK